MIQKTWFELLGPVTSLDFVDGSDLVRWVGGNNYRTLWNCKTPELAQRCWDQWVLETLKAATGKAVQS